MRMDCFSTIFSLFCPTIHGHRDTIYQMENMCELFSFHMIFSLFVWRWRIILRSSHMRIIFLLAFDYSLHYGGIKDRNMWTQNHSKNSDWWKTPEPSIREKKHIQRKWVFHAVISDVMWSKCYFTKWMVQRMWECVSCGIIIGFR